MTQTRTNPAQISWQLMPADALTNDETLRSAWNALNAAGPNLPFMDAQIVAVAQQLFGTGKERLAVARTQERIIATTLVVKMDAIRWTTFQPSQLPLGAWLSHPDIDLAALSQSLIRVLPGIALAVSVTQADPRFVARPPNAPAFRTDDYIDTGWVDIDGSFDAYWSARGKNLRQNMRKQHNKLDAENCAAAMRTFTRAEDMADAVARYGNLESGGWKADLGTAIHKDNDQGHFYTDMLTRAAHAGEAVVYEYLINNEVAASNLCVRRGDTQVLLKTTYDEKYKQISPALLLLHDELQALFDEGKIKHLEFYGRMKDWHTRWTDTKRALFHATTYRASLIRKLAERRHRDTADETIASEA